MGKHMDREMETGSCRDICRLELVVENGGRERTM